MTTRTTTTCEQRALKWVHTYAAGGAVFATLPIPGSSLALGALETHMIYWIAKVYGETLSPTEVLAVAGTIELGGMALKALALEACNFIPIAGWLVKSSIAGSAIEGIGRVIIKHYEDKYPGKLYTADSTVESSLEKKGTSS